MANYYDVETYDPHTWETGEIITEQKLNHIEQYLAEIENPYTVWFEYDWQGRMTCSATWTQIEYVVTHTTRPLRAVCRERNGVSRTVLQVGEFHESIPEESSPGYCVFYWPMKLNGSDWARDFVIVHDDDALELGTEPEPAV